MTAVTPTSAEDTPGTTSHAASASHSRRRGSTGKSVHATTPNRSTTIRDLVPAGLSDGAGGVPVIQAKYTKVCHWTIGLNIVCSKR